jgi:hypothetical protein
MKTKRNYRRLYAIVAHHPDYTAASRDNLIRGYVWGHTKERTYHKTELSDREYAALCASLEKDLNVPPVRHRTAYPKGDNTPEGWRRKLLAATHEHIMLSGYGEDQHYLNDKTDYAMGIILRAASSKERSVAAFNKLSLVKLQSLYNAFVQNNSTQRNINNNKKK